MKTTKPTDPIQIANEEKNPSLRILRIHIREPKVRAIEIRGNRLFKGRAHKLGERLIVVDPANLPTGFVLAKDAAELIEANMAVGITEDQLQAEEATV
jgi:hypothetical protein